MANSLNHLLVHQFMKVFGISRLRASWLQPAYYLGYVAHDATSYAVSYTLPLRGYLDSRCAMWLLPRAEQPTVQAVASA